MKRKLLINKAQAILKELKASKRDASGGHSAPSLSQGPGPEESEAKSSSKESPGKGDRAKLSSGSKKDLDTKPLSKDKGDKDKKSKRDRANNDALSRLDSLLSGADENSPEEQEENDEIDLERVRTTHKGKTSKQEKLDDKVEKKSLRGQPRPDVSRKSPPESCKTLPQDSILREIQAEMADIMESMPVNRKEMEKQITGYLGKLKYLTLRKAEKILLSLEYTPASELIKLAKELTDMQLAVKWTRKLEKAILENPSKLKRPGSGSGWSLLSRVQEMAKSTKQEQNRDGRQSGIKKGNELVTRAGESSEMDLPSDDLGDAASKKAEGA